jgi:hypothetical protein
MVFLQRGLVWSVVSSVGTRYKLSPLRDLIDLRFQYFFFQLGGWFKSNPAIYKENKANDWLVWLNVYIYCNRSTILYKKSPNLRFRIGLFMDYLSKKRRD